MPLFLYFGVGLDALLFFHVPFSTDCSLVGEMISIIVYLDYIDTRLVGSLEYEIYGLLCFQSEESDNNDCRSYALRHTAPAVQKKNERESLYFRRVVERKWSSTTTFFPPFFSLLENEVRYKYVYALSLYFSLRVSWYTADGTIGYEVLMFFYANEPLISEPAEADY